VSPNVKSAREFSIWIPRTECSGRPATRFQNSTFVLKPKTSESSPEAIAGSKQKSHSGKESQSPENWNHGLTVLLFDGLKQES
jgi:hypothetical protein